MQRETHLNWY